MFVNGKNEKTAHLVWCAMIALHLARKDGRVRSEQQENLFLIRRMPQMGRSLSVRAQLVKKLDYIWRSTTGNIMEQTAPVPARITGNLASCGWLIQPSQEPDVLFLMAAPCGPDDVNDSHG